MTYQLLDTIVLDRDMPDRGLRKGDLGAVVEVYGPDGLEVEFVTASRRTAALVTLDVGDVGAVKRAASRLAMGRGVTPGRLIERDRGTRP